MLWKVLDGLRRSLDGSGLFGMALGSSGPGTVLDGFGRFWEVLEGCGWALVGLSTALDEALNAALERIWTALDGLDGFKICLAGSGMLWAALGSFEYQSGAYSQLTGCEKSCSDRCGEAYFAKSMFCIAEACSLAKIAKKRRNHW